MESICFTDHMDTDSEEPEFILDTDAYIPYMLELREEYREKTEDQDRVEIGMQPHLADRHREYVKQYPFDFVIASLHLVDEKIRTIRRCLKAGRPGSVSKISGILSGKCTGIRRISGAGTHQLRCQVRWHKALQYGYDEYRDVT